MADRDPVSEVRRSIKNLSANPRAPRRPSKRVRSTVPSVESFSPARPRTPSPFDNVVLGSTTPRPERTPGRKSAAAVEAAMGIDYETALAIQKSKAGDDTELLPYQPTPSINPPRPRTLAAGYDPDTQTLRVRFRDGTPWAYYDVPPAVWQRFRRTNSPGRFINAVLNNHEYSRGDF